MRILRRKSFLGGVILLMCLSLLSPSSVLATPFFEKASDTLSDSDVSAVGVTHTFLASTTATGGIPANGYIEVVFPSDFTNIVTSTVVCPTGGVPDGRGQIVTCDFASGLAATSTIVVVPGVTNPSTIGTYKLNLYTKQQNGTEIERSNVAVAIVNDVDVTASVEAYLLFTIGGLATSSVVNGVSTTGSSSPVLMEFGILPEDTPRTLGQQLRVTTNAALGFSVTVSQDHNLLAGNGADIDSFIDGNPASTTAYAWTNPGFIVTDENTFGHMGVTSDDANFAGGADTYGASLYRGMEGTDPLEVMYAAGAADGSTDSIGSTTVAYTIEVSALQEMGDYSNTLTYVCTPNY